MTFHANVDWSARATLAQRSLEHFYGAAQPQFLDNFSPLGEGNNETFNYWWLAHLIDARLDAFERTGEQEWLDAAIAAFNNIRERNDGSLFNDYFDDMLWLGISALRLHEASGDPAYLTAAVEIWDHVVEFGWNDTFGASLAWRKQQLYYKNTPANGPLIILACRLDRHRPDARYLQFATASWAWLTEVLVDPITGFVEDGINREQDGRIDTQWRFTYNQGLYVGAGSELFRATGDSSYLEAAQRTALTALDALAVNGVFTDEGEGGDEGLFKGVYYRYLRDLLPLIPETAASDRLTAFVESSSDALWTHAQRDEWFFAGNDWNRQPEGRVPYSTQLSAIMALELAAVLAKRAALESASGLADN